MLKVCEIWNENSNFTTNDIANKLHLGQSTVARYLHKGAEVGLCDYSCETGKKRGTNKNFGEANTRSKKVFYNNIIYCSIREFANVIGEHEGNVRRWLIGERKPVNENKIYSSAHYATEEEIKKYSKYYNFND
jgi:predicted transcriptional regulator